MDNRNGQVLVFEYEDSQPPIGSDIARSRQQLLAALVPLGNIASGATAGLLSKIMGRRLSLAVGRVVFITATVILMVAVSIDVLFLGRFLLGVVFGTYVSATAGISDSFEQQVGLYAYFWAVACLLSAAWILMFLPELRDRTIEEIDEMNEFDHIRGAVIVDEDKERTTVHPPISVTTPNQTLVELIGGTCAKVRRP
ncbi:MFS transporter [Diaporthe eres]|nr:MFS transporter [Diaporthe eres]